MKVNFLILIHLLFVSQAFAQPSAEQVKSDVKMALGGTTTVEVIGAGDNTVEWDNNIRTNYHRRQVRATSASIDPKYPDVKVVYTGLAVYNTTGSSYSFKRFNPGTTELIGMPNPSAEELNNLLQSKLTEVIRNGESVIGMPEGLEITENTPYIWHDLNSLSFMATAKFTERSNYTTLRTIQQNYEIRLYRDNPDAKWTRIFAKRQEDPTILETKTYTSDEIDGMKTMNYLFAEQQASATLKRLPKVESPKISDVSQMFDYVGTLLMEGDADLAEAKLRAVLANHFFAQNDRLIPTNSGQALIDAVRNAVSANQGYAYQYCGIPDEKERGNTYVVWYNKDRSNFSRLGVTQNGSALQLSELDVRIASDAAKKKELSVIPCTTLKLGPVRRGERKISDMKNGDVVLGYYEQDGFWYVAKLIGYQNNYYNVHYLFDNTKGNIRQAVPFTLEVGDRAFYNMDGTGTNPVEVIAVNGNNVTIRKNDGTELNTESRLLIFKP